MGARGREGGVVGTTELSGSSGQVESPGVGPLPLGHVANMSSGA